jgi:hypothetical protein
VHHWTFFSGLTTKPGNSLSPPVRTQTTGIGTPQEYLSRQKAVLVNALQLDAQSKSLQTPTIMINITPTQLRKAADIQEKIQSLQNELAEILGGEAPIPAQMPEAPKRRKFSAAAKAKMRAAQKARWAKIKATAPEAKPAPEPKRKLSAQGIANIRAGVAKRMAAQGKAPIANPVKKARKKISAAGLANIRAAQKARWAKSRAAKKA